MENMSRQEQPAETPFDFSKYTQPEAPEVVESPTATPFDFSQYQDAQKSFEEIGEEINAHNRLTKGYDFSDENIATGGPVLRELTPAEMYENGKRDQQAEQVTTRQGKLGSSTVGKLFRRN